jgi:Flp pilus assembly protein TadB
VFAASIPPAPGSGLADDGRAARRHAGESTGASVVGRLAAATWAVGLAVGLIALVIGDPMVASVALIVAVTAPWFGLAWMLHNQRRVFVAEPDRAAKRSHKRAPLPSSGYRIRFPAR